MRRRKRRRKKTNDFVFRSGQCGTCSGCGIAFDVHVAAGVGVKVHGARAPISNILQCVCVSYMYPY